MLTAQQQIFRPMLEHSVLMPWFAHIMNLVVQEFPQCNSMGNQILQLFSQFSISETSMQSKMQPTPNSTRWTPKCSPIAFQSEFSKSELKKPELMIESRTREWTLARIIWHSETNTSGNFVDQKYCQHHGIFRNQVLRSFSFARKIELITMVLRCQKVRVRKL